MKRFSDFSKWVSTHLLSRWNSWNSFKKLLKCMHLWNRRNRKYPYSTSSHPYCIYALTNRTEYYASLLSCVLFFVEGEMYDTLHVFCEKLPHKALVQKADCTDLEGILKRDLPLLSVQSAISCVKVTHYSDTSVAPVDVPVNSGAYWLCMRAAPAW